MDIRQLIEKMEEFAGEKVGQKSGEQWRGTDKGTPGKKLVGDSIIKDLSKGPTPKTKEQELAEEWATFSEENIGTHPKRPRRTSDRHSRGHEPQARYKTVKADEAANPAQQAAIAIAMKKAGKKPRNEGAEQDPVVARVVKQMRPGLKNLDMGNEAFLYFAYELGKQRARDAWEDYLPAIRDEYEKGLNEDANTDNKLAKLLTRFINQNEGADRAVAGDAIEYIKKIGHIEQFATSLDYFGADLDEGLEEASYYGPVEARWMVKLSDDEGDHLKTFHDKFPSLSAAKKAYKNTPYATDFKYKPVKKDQVEEAIDSDIVQPMGQDSINRAGYNPLRDKNDYDKKVNDLIELGKQQGQNKQMQDQIQQRILDLRTAAIAKGFIQAESRGHTIIANKLKDVERAKKFASGELKVPTPQERQAQLKQLEKAKPVKEYGANNPPQGSAVTPYGQPAVDPKQAQALAQGTQAFKSATGITAPTTNIVKAIDDISQGKPATQQSMKTLEPALQDLATILKTPKIASGSFKTAMQQANQEQLKLQQQAISKQS